MAQARYKSLVDTLAARIRSGQLPPGSRLPTHRRLAATEGIALVTASRVYAELEAMGLVSGEAGRGTFVRDISLPAGLGIDQREVAAGVADLSFNAPALPGQADLLRDALRRLASAGDLDSLLRYQPHAGRTHERAIVARHLAARGLDVGGEQVLLVSGAQHGLAVTVMALLQPGDVVAVDALSYPGFKVLAQAHRLELAPLAVTEDGPDLEALARLCCSRRVRAVYSMPTLHNPLGWVMSVAQRLRLVALARQHRLLIIEDAAYAFLADEAPAPLAQLAPECTVYVSGLSKSLATGLRVGFVAAPLKLVPALERAIRASTWNTPGVMTAIACGWLADGTVARLEAEKRQDAKIRQTLAASLLSEWHGVGHPASYFLWLPLAEDARAEQVAAALRSEGVAVSTAEPFATSAQLPQAIRLALGSVELVALRRALQTVARVVAAHAYGTAAGSRLDAARRWKSL